MEETVAEDEIELPRWVRPVVYGLLAAVLVCGLARIELWPFSGFRLFSALRTGDRVSWQIVAVDGDGDEQTVQLRDLPVGFRNTTTLLPGLEEAPAPERDEVCEAWAAPLRDAGRDVALVRIYKKTTDVRPGSPPAQRELAWECARR